MYRDLQFQKENRNQDTCLKIIVEKLNKSLKKLEHSEEWKTEEISSIERKEI